MSSPRGRTTEPDFSMCANGAAIPGASPLGAAYEPADRTAKPKLETSTHMELIVVILMAGRIGVFVHGYENALTAYLAAWPIALPIQTVVVYSEDDGGWLYWLFNGLILAAGVGLNRFGSALGRRSRTRNLAA